MDECCLFAWASEEAGCKLHCSCEGGGLWVGRGAVPGDGAEGCTSALEFPIFKEYFASFYSCSLESHSWCRIEVALYLGYHGKSCKSASNCELAFSLVFVCAQQCD